MPILKKVINHGGSRGITLPASWLDLIEKESGKPVKEVLMEVDGAITIKPVIETKDSVPSRQAEHAILANQPSQVACVDV
jgi:antitoxin component of MazEF toxin-antitoxin module